MIELIMVIATMAILLTLAAPAMQTVTARAEIKSAADEISQAIRLAKNTARVRSQPVTVSFSTGASGNSISFAFANGSDTSGTAANRVKLPAIALPERISVASTQTSFLFDPMGIIINFNQANNIVLTSSLVSSEALTLSVVNELGYVTLADGVPQ